VIAEILKGRPGILAGNIPAMRSYMRVDTHRKYCGECAVGLDWNAARQTLQEFCKDRNDPSAKYSSFLHEKMELIDLVRLKIEGEDRREQIKRLRENA
jgi:hypothetical protein